MSWPLLFLFSNLFIKSLFLQTFFYCVSVTDWPCFYDRVPQKNDQGFGGIQQGSLCVDTMGNFQDGILGLFPCHNSGGNQVTPTCAITLTHHSLLFCVVLKGLLLGSSISILPFKDATPVSFRSELFTSYILTIFKQ